MNSLTKKMRLTLAALALATAPVSMALAESNYDPYGLEGSNLAVVSNPVETQTGSDAYPTFSPNAVVGVRTGGVVALAGSQSEPQPVNALTHSVTTNDVRLFAQAVNQ
jgi:hypothetical protein